MIVLEFIELLRENLLSTFSGRGYQVQAREPLDDELGPLQLWVVTENMRTPEGIADLGLSTRIIVPVYVSLVIDFPQTEDDAYAALERRLNVIQAAQQAAHDFVTDREESPLVTLMGEDSFLKNGFLICAFQIDVEYDLRTS